MKYFQVGKNLRNNRDGSHGDTDGKNDNQRDAIAVWTGQRWDDQPVAEDQAKHEWHPCADDGQPRDFPPLLAGEKMLSFCSRKEHQQQQAQPVNEVENISLMPCGIEQMSYEWQSAEHGWT